MEGFKTFQSIAISAYILVLICSVKSVNGQISTPCSFSMITSFTPCLNYITGSSSNGLSPTTDCCSSLKTILSSGMDCACLLITASVPIQLPINRTLALSLPSACNINGVPIQCKSSGSPLPASGPASLLEPTPAPEADSPSSIESKATSTDPESEELSPASSPGIESEGPTATNPGIRPVLGPPSSASTLPHLIPSSLPHMIIATMMYLIMFY
ncbi:non-specific lipid transfer protein GPI-anchored 16-like [Humulus lupulus]|uniref:non-specific lipid transfer protein GPI-anchored 16-like n=1 Tax=Humulus lupulus TaxID=3486 RepID=UPI002B40EC4B|nr:non-specific lipid transfer protein GPI-anchored 16-like [Humulus lupulus]